MAAQPPAPLLLTASDGPWMWRVVRYSLLAGALDPLASMHTQHAINQLESLGTVVSTVHGEWPRSSYSDAGLSFRFEDAAEEPEPQELTLRLTSFDGAGVGHQVWNSAILLALLMRSPTAPQLPPRPRILELGAGVGLPGLDLARLHDSVVTLSDARSKLIRLLEHNAGANSECRGEGASVEVRELTWGDGNETLAAAAAAAEQQQQQRKEKTAATGAEAACHHPKEERRAVHGAYDLVVGADVCYEASSVAPLVELLTAQLRAPLSIIVGPETRPSLAALGAALEAVPGVRVEWRRLSLVSSAAEVEAEEAGAEGGDTKGGRELPGSTHLVLIVRQSSPRQAA